MNAMHPNLVGTTPTAPDPDRLEALISEYRVYDSDMKLFRIHGTAIIGEFVDALAELRQARIAQQCDAEHPGVTALAQALRNVRQAIMQAPPGVLCCTLWMSGLCPETVVDHIDAALTRAPSAQGGEDIWQPIETAPCNVPVLLFCPDRGCESNPARIELDYASCGFSDAVANNISRHSWATHWMPLPPFPVAPPKGDRE